MVSYVVIPHLGHSRLKGSVQVAERMLMILCHQRDALVSVFWVNQYAGADSRKPDPFAGYAY